MSMNLGEIAYNAYGNSRGWKVFNGDPMPSWDEQDTAIQMAWIAAAQAVADAVRLGDRFGRHARPNLNG